METVWKSQQPGWVLNKEGKAGGRSASGGVEGGAALLCDGAVCMQLLHPRTARYTEGFLREIMASGGPEGL